MISIIEPELLLENEQTQELNGLITAIATAPYSSELEGAFYIGSRDIDDNNIFWLYKVDKRVKQGGTITLYGTYSLFDDLKAYDVIRDKRPKNVSTLGGISIVLEGSRWQVGNVTSTKLGTENFYYVSRLEAFWKYLEAWGVEFKPRMTYSKGKITGRYIDIADRLSNDYGKWYEYGDKLMQVTAEQASDSLYTAFIGRGKGEETGDGFGRRIGFDKVVWTKASGKPVDKPINQDFIEIPEATAEYGYSDGKPRTTVVIFEETEDDNLLIQQTYDYAINECRPKLQMKSNVIENGLSELGEVCAIIRDDLGIRYKTRVFKIVRNFLNKNEKSVEFGDEIVISSAKRNSNAANAIKKQEEQTLYWLDNIRQQVIDSYFNEDGYNYDFKTDNEYSLPAGYYSFDRPIDQNPTKVVYMGAGKIMIANSKLANGQWKWTTAIDGDGANLSAVNTGILQAGRIKSAVDGSYWDLDGGELNLKSGLFNGTNYKLDLGLGKELFKNPSNGNTLTIQQDKFFFDTTGASHYLVPNNEGLDLIPASTNVGDDRNAGLKLRSSNFNYLDLGIGSDLGYKYRIAGYADSLTFMNKNKGDFVFAHDAITDYNIGKSIWSLKNGLYGSFEFGKTRIVMNGYDGTTPPKVRIANAGTDESTEFEAGYITIANNGVDSGSIRLTQSGSNFRINHPNTERRWEFLDGNYGNIKFGKTKIVLNGYDSTVPSKVRILNEVNQPAILEVGYLDIRNPDGNVELKQKGSSFIINHGTSRNWVFEQGNNGALTYGITSLVLNGHNPVAARLSIMDNTATKYGYMSAANFDVQSERKSKSDIKDFNGALSIISTMKVHKYIKNGVSEIGIITDEAPLQLLSDNQTKVSLYDYISLVASGVKDLEKIAWEQEVKMSKLEERIKEMEVLN